VALLTDDTADVHWTGLPVSGLPVAKSEDMSFLELAGLRHRFRTPLLSAEGTETLDNPRDHSLRCRGVDIIEATTITTKRNAVTDVGDAAPAKDVPVDRAPAAALRMVHDEEVALVERLQRRDPAALADLYDRYGRLTYSLIKRIVRDAGIAEDLTQETFFRVWTSVGSFEARRAFCPWLLTIARNRAIDYLRASDDRWNYGSPKLDQVDDPRLLADLERSVAISGILRTLGGAMEKLSVNQRRVIDLAYFGGYSQTEMAAKLGQPLGTVKTWIRTALNLLREELRVPSAVVPIDAHKLSTRPGNVREQAPLERLSRMRHVFMAGHIQPDPPSALCRNGENVKQ
jgi:RNA polymerase sigma-70 factor (ECF subfamily)